MSHLLTVLHPLAQAEGLLIEDVQTDAHTVRVVVDLPDGTQSVTADQLALLTTRISVTLDDLEAAGQLELPETYELEVTSPGIERPLTELRHWLRNLGRLVLVRTEESQVQGRLLAADEETVLLQENRKGQMHEHRLERDLITHAVVVPELRHAKEA